jgi:hypothetical protein
MFPYHVSTQSIAMANSSCNGVEVTGIKLGSIFTAVINLSQAHNFRPKFHIIVGAGSVPSITPTGPT